MTNDGKVVIMGAYPVPVGEGGLTTACWRSVVEKSAIDGVAQGWQCPVCGKVHAPWVASCDCHKIQRESIE